MLKIIPELRVLKPYHLFFKAIKQSTVPEIEMKLFKMFNLTFYRLTDLCAIDSINFFSISDI